MATWIQDQVSSSYHGYHWLMLWHLKSCVARSPTRNSFPGFGRVQIELRRLRKRLFEAEVMTGFVFAAA